MGTILFYLPRNEKLATALALKINAAVGSFTVRHFPDAESYVRIFSDCKDKEAMVVDTLDRPDDKLLPLYFLCKGLKEMGATKVTLVAPYLAYMRQDKKFNPGEVVTSDHFAKLLSSFADELITIDPHLHRRHSMAEIYSIPCTVLHAADLIAHWIRDNIAKPLLIGPDSESEQWVSKVAQQSGAPYVVLEKIRQADTAVTVSIPDVEQYLEYTPVLVDDIISTARTMIETVNHLKAAGMKPPVCVGVHAVFAGNAYENLKNAGADQILTCNTIEHVSNVIDISELLVKVIRGSDEK